jgi:hypothetical protein
MYNNLAEEYVPNRRGKGTLIYGLGFISLVAIIAMIGIPLTGISFSTGQLLDAGSVVGQGIVKQKGSSIAVAKVSGGYYNPIGNPTISVAVFKQFLKECNSPAYGEAETVYKFIVEQGGDPAVSVAFFELESTCGQFGVANTSKGWGNIRYTTGKTVLGNNYLCIPAGNNGFFRGYNTWAEGAADWAVLLQFYKNSWGLSTLEQIIPRYAPAADHNNEAAYINGVKKRIDNLRGRQ